MLEHVFSVLSMVRTADHEGLMNKPVSEFTECGKFRGGFSCVSVCECLGFYSIFCLSRVCFESFQLQPHMLLSYETTHICHKGHGLILCLHVVT